jgi:hypothetical protein
LLDLVNYLLKEFHTVKTNKTYALILNRVDGEESYVIGAFEAQSIAMHLEKKSNHLALAYDLFKILLNV